jgi:2-polyprenyl-3-methyl-5-hydroxy-6-metoxy-1,4-benzoquinol methylase
LIRRPHRVGLSQLSHAHDWDGSYRKGEWDYLRRFDEEVRYAVLAGCIAGHDSEPPAAVLDLGCGVGLLREHLPSGSIDLYTGLDWSREAVEQAQLNGHERSVFVAASIDEWEPDGRYDAIVFSEVLYYLPQPVATVARYARSLRNGGSIFLSMWHPAIFISARHPTSAKIIRARLGYSSIWRALNRQYEIVADIVVKRDRLQRWRVRQLRPVGL